MQKFITFLLSLATIVVLSVALSSCKDDEPPVQPKLSFSVATMTVKESDGTIEVEIVLDKPAPKDISVEYSLDGTADEKSSVGANEAYDYEIPDNLGEIDIDKGETTGIIEIALISDAYIEDPEKIEIKIESATEGIELTREDEIEITVEQEDGLIIALDWPAPTATAYADMDLLVRFGASVPNWDERFFAGSVQETNVSPEFIFIPKTTGNAAFGMSYTYYDGTLDPLNFTVRFIDLVNGALEAEATRQTFNGTYTAVNKNKWQDPNTTQVVQTFVKSGESFTNISSITAPAAGSRMITSPDIQSSLKKGNKIYHNGGLLKKLAPK